MYNSIFIQSLFPYRISWLIEHKYKWNPFCEILWYINWKSADCEVDFKSIKYDSSQHLCIRNKQNNIVAPFKQTSKNKIPTKLSCQGWHVFQRDYFLW